MTFTLTSATRVEWDCTFDLDGRIHNATLTVRRLPLRDEYVVDVLAAGWLRSDSLILTPDGWRRAPVRNPTATRFPSIDAAIAAAIETEQIGVSE